MNGWPGFYQAVTNENTTMLLKPQLILLPGLKSLVCLTELSSHLRSQTTSNETLHQALKRLSSQNHSSIPPSQGCAQRVRGEPTILKSYWVKSSPLITLWAGQ